MKKELQKGEKQSNQRNRDGSSTGVTAASLAVKVDGTGRDSLVLVAELTRLE